MFSAEALQSLHSASFFYLSTKINLFLLSLMDFLAFFFFYQFLNQTFHFLIGYFQFVQPYKIVYFLKIFSVVWVQASFFKCFWDKAIFCRNGLIHILCNVFYNIIWFYSIFLNFSSHLFLNKFFFNSLIFFSVVNAFPPRSYV